MVKCRGSQSVVWRYLGDPEILSGDREVKTIFIVAICFFVLIFSQVEVFFTVHLGNMHNSKSIFSND